MPDAPDILLLMLVLMVLAGFSGWIAFWIARVAGRQKIAENLLRERLARAWGPHALTPRQETEQS